ncbi:SseB family protein [Brevibacterium senegalense]|uniref:SseB family protein n=1 Tax=Brevibacterium senegalense TaxID=1033736 RepID=UPI0002EDC43F|nr:SseB family protein [Brevibacterium senegalense]
MTDPTGGSPQIPAHLQGAMGGPADSAGVPWGGRELHSNPFAGDTGEADPGLLEALRAVAAQPLEPQRHQRVLSALAGARLYAPILPTVLEQTVDDRGLMHDNSSEMAMVRLTSGDGREATPAFTDIPALTAWHPDARPVPIEAERLGAAAVEEGAQLVVLDPGTPHTFLLRRPALWSFLQGLPWVPAWADAAVASALRTATGEFGWITGVGLGPASRAVHAGGTEVRIEVRAAGAPTTQQSAQLQEALAASEPLVERIDSLALTFTQV